MADPYPTAEYSIHWLESGRTRHPLPIDAAFVARKKEGWYIYNAGIAKIAYSQPTQEIQ